ncbi:hypothetical protein HYU11_02415 [Candidatus Woesearchaeota archaeon]|nr:hypothetical protein [Candidatus Woesearchaeota archaeon]
MKLTHSFISALDMNEQLPFALKKTKTLQESFAEQERAKEELQKFIKKLEKNLNEDMCYIGMDVIGEKSYERFMLKNSGFFELIVENPVAMTAHFPETKRAENFLNALKKTLDQTLPRGPAKDIFLNSLEVNQDEDTSLKVEGWHKIKEIRGK